MTSSLLEWLSGLRWSDPNVRGVAGAALATLALIVVLKLLAGLFRRLRGRVNERIAARHTAVRVQRLELASSHTVQRSAGWVLGLAHLLAAVVLIDVYLVLVLRIFPGTEQLSGEYFDFVLAPVVALYRAAVDYLPNAVYILVVSAVALLALRFLHVLFRALESGAISLPGFYRDWADPTYKLVRGLIHVFLLIAIFPRLPGADEQAFKAVSLFIGALLTLGSTAAVGNAVAGVVLIYTRAFQIGDWVRVGNTTGEVIHKTLLVTRLRTAACEQVTIPNGEVLRDHVVNFTPAARKGTLGLTASVQIGYDADWRVVEELLLKAAAATPNLSAEPPPLVLTTALDSFSVDHMLRVATSGPPPLGSIGSALRRNILDEFQRAGIEILSPTVSVLRQEDQQAIPSPGRPSQMEEDG